MNTEAILDYLKRAGVDLLKGILVLVVGFFLVHWVSKLLKHNTNSRQSSRRCGDSCTI